MNGKAGVPRLVLAQPGEALHVAAWFGKAGEASRGEEG